MNKENWEGGNKAENKLEKLLENEKVRESIDAIITFWDTTQKIKGRGTRQSTREKEKLTIDDFRKSGGVMDLIKQELEIIKEVAKKIDPEIDKKTIVQLIVDEVNKALISDLKKEK